MDKRIRKGSIVRVTTAGYPPIVLRVAKREKWGKTSVRLHFEPVQDGYPRRHFGHGQLLPMTNLLFVEGGFESVELVSSEYAK